MLANGADSYQINNEPEHGDKPLSTHPTRRAERPTREACHLMSGLIESNGVDTESPAPKPRTAGDFQAAADIGLRAPNVWMEGAPAQRTRPPEAGGVGSALPTTPTHARPTDPQRTCRSPSHEPSSPSPVDVRACPAKRTRNLLPNADRDLAGADRAPRAPPGGQIQSRARRSVLADSDATAIG